MDCQRAELAGVQPVVAPTLPAPLAKRLAALSALSTFASFASFVRRTLIVGTIWIWWADTWHVSRMLFETPMALVYSCLVCRAIVPSSAFAGLVVFAQLAALLVGEEFVLIVIGGVVLPLSLSARRSGPGPSTCLCRARRELGVASAQLGSSYPTVSCPPCLPAAGYLP